MASFRPGDPGFDIDAQIIPQARRGRLSAWVIVALGGAIGLLIAIVVVGFRHLDRPAVSEMRGTLDAKWIPMMAPNERNFVIVEIEGHR